MSARRWASASADLDVLIVSLGSTAGLRAADEDLAASLRRAGATVALASAARPASARTLMLTDLSWARAARAAAIAALRDSRPRAIVYSTTTAALLWPEPGAIRFDAPAAGNRPGRHGLWQRPLERRRLAQAPLLLALTEGGLAEAGRTQSDRALVVPLAVEAASSRVDGSGEDASSPGDAARQAALGSAGASGQVASSRGDLSGQAAPARAEASGRPAPARDIAAITYAGNPRKKGLDRVLAAWRQVRAAGDAGPLGSATTGEAGASGSATAGEAAASSEGPAAGGGGELVVAGASKEELRRAGFDLSGEPGVRDAGPLPADEYRALLRRARVFVTAPRREDYGQAQLEALADGCLLATTPAPGPYAALPIAWRLDPALVDEDLAAALTRALTHRDPTGYAARARTELAPLRPDAVDALIAEQVLPRLLGGAPLLAG